MRAKCKKCRMGFRIEKPINRAADFTTCRCGQRFWHALKWLGGENRFGTVAVGVLREDMTDNLEDMA